MKWLLAVSALLVSLSVNSFDFPYDKHSKKEIECLAQAIYHEARGESDTGKFAVAHVVINRHKSEKYPNSICQIVYQPFQFSWTRDKSIKPKYDTTTLAIAKLVLLGFSPLENFKATHFHNKTVRPNWNLKKVAVIGNHIFYKHYEK